MRRLPESSLATSASIVLESSSPMLQRIEAGLQGFFGSCANRSVSQCLPVLLLAGCDVSIPRQANMVSLPKLTMGRPDCQPLRATPHELTLVPMLMQTVLQSKIPTIFCSPNMPDLISIKTHLLRINGVWDLPQFNNLGFAREIIGGWEISGLVNYSTGTPFSVTTGAAAPWLGAGRDIGSLRLNRVGSPVVVAGAATPGPERDTSVRRHMSRLQPEPSATADAIASSVLPTLIPTSAL